MSRQASSSPHSSPYGALFVPFSASPSHTVGLSRAASSSACSKADSWVGYWYILQCSIEGTRWFTALACSTARPHYRAPLVVYLRRVWRKLAMVVITGGPGYFSVRPYSNSYNTRFQPLTEELSRGHCYHTVWNCLFFHHAEYTSGR